MSRLLFTGLLLGVTAYGQSLAVPPQLLHGAAPVQTVRPAGNGVTQDDIARLNTIMSRMSSKDQKQFAKAMKKLTPAQRTQVVQSLRPAKTLAEQTKRKDAQKVQPLPPRLKF
jgi:hypothetical protein